MVARGRRPGSATGQVVTGQAAARRTTAGRAPAGRSAAKPAPLPDHAGVIVAVLLDPPLPVQAVWQAAPATHEAPLAVGTPEGSILAACPRATVCGIAAGQSMAQARLRCPDLRVLPPDHAAASLLWDTLLGALADVSPLVKAADGENGLAYLDARGLDPLWGDGAAVARQALRTLAARGLAARAGAGPTRAVARALARRMADDGPHVLSRAEARPFLYALPLHDPALGLPSATVAALADLGLHRAEDLAVLPRDALALRFDAPVLAAWEIATRLDDVPLHPWTAPDILALDYRPEGGLADRTMLTRLLGELAVGLAARLTARERTAGTLTLTLSCENGAVLTQRARHAPPLRAASRIAAAARDLLDRGDPSAAVEEVTLMASDLCTVGVTQRGLWDAGTADRGAGGTGLLADALRAQARRHEHSSLRRLRRDPLSPDGWAWDEADGAP